MSSDQEIVLTGVEKYRSEVLSLPRLTRSEEGELVYRARNGDTQAKETLIQSCLGYVASVAYRYVCYAQHDDYLDLVSVGNLAIVEYRLRPNKAQEKVLMEILLVSRQMYNACLEELISHYRDTGKYLHLYKQDKRHNKTTHPDLPAVVVDTVLKRLHRSFTNFFCGRKARRKIGFPRFKNANAWNTIQFRDARNHLDGCYFVAPKLCGGRIRVVLHRPMEGTFKFARILLRPSGWHLQCVCETIPEPLPKKNNAVGLDMGIRYLVTDSNGQFIDNPKYARKTATRLAKETGSVQEWKLPPQKGKAYYCPYP
jgi:hypothetical protein